MSFSLLAAAGAPNPLLPATAEIVVGFVAFGLLYLVMRRRVVPMFEKAFTARTEAIQGGIERAEKAQAEAAEALVQLHRATFKRHKLNRNQSAKRHVFREQQFLKSFAQRHRKKQHASQRMLTPQSKQSVNKRLHHFAMKLVRSQLNWLQRLLEKHWMIRRVSHASLIVSLKI
jgi:F0F1-type ATP synthase membrane subunit b/b'